MTENPIIEVRNLSKSFGEKEILRDINFKVYEKESVVILGQSGTGKSVLFKNMLGLLPSSGGEIYFYGKPTTHLKEKERFKLNYQISMVFQSSALFDSYTVLDNILLGIMSSRKLEKTEQKQIAIEALEKVGLDASILELTPAEISGGMQKRVALARAIAPKPKIIFFDEPTSGLDPISSNVINKLILDITKYLGVTALTITHDINSAKHISSKILLLHEKSIVWEGTRNELYTTDNQLVQNFVNGISS